MPTRYILIYWITNGTAMAITIMITNATIAISIIVNPLSDDRIRLLPGSLNERCASPGPSTVTDAVARCHIWLHSRNNIPQTSRETTPESSVDRLITGSETSYLVTSLGVRWKRPDACSTIPRGKAYSTRQVLLPGSPEPGW